MNCQICQQKDESGDLTLQAVGSRKRWGCDAATELDLFRVPDGAGGWVGVRRCPWAQAVPQWSPVIQYLSFAAEHGVFPVAGGMLDQTASFLRALVIYKAELARLRERDQEQTESNHAQ
jgi:hypothetical protein